MPPVSDVPKNLKALVWHGVDLSWEPDQTDGHVKGECPFCGKPKFSVNVETGLWDCKAGSCGHSGNPIEFLRQLWDVAREKPSEWGKLAKERKLVDQGTPAAWGVVQSPVTDEWLVPAFSADGRLHNLYVWRGTGKKRLIPTPGVWSDGESHGVFAPASSTQAAKDSMGRPGNPGKVTCPTGTERLWILEGPWDGMAVWETLNHLGRLDTSTVVAVPGAGTFSERWASVASSQRVVLGFDNDHPRLVDGQATPGAGTLGAKRTAKILARAAETPREIKWVSWGKGGFDPLLPSGHDLRDLLSVAGDDLDTRGRLLDEAEKLITTIPEDWLPKGSNDPTAHPGGKPDLQPLDCSSWRILLGAWKKAMLWRQDLEDVLSVMLAVAVSTVQVGDQLFLQVIGDAGSGKTRMCDAMLVSPYCFPLEHLTGFHSGWSDGSGEDYSLLTRINKKTLITPEGDVMMSSPKFAEIMSQQRRIFDGTSGATYKNRKEDLRYTGLRTPWIMAGTPALLDVDQSRLGDRFLRIRIRPPGEDEKRAILRRIGYTAIRSVRQTSDSTPESHIEERLCHAYRLTGGYVDFLRRTAETSLNRLDLDEDELVDRCSLLADFTASLRARPPKDRGKERDGEDAKELPSRLQHQFVRLACCLAVVLNRPTVDETVMRIVKKVAVDTTWWKALDVTKALYQAGVNGLSSGRIAGAIDQGEDGLKTFLAFLKSVGVAQTFRQSSGSGITQLVKWKLTGRMSRLCTEVMGEDWECRQ